MASTKNSKDIAAAQKAGRYAASEWEPGEISINDHRLRSLMNFERDVVKSTWDDTEALPLWNAFLQAFDEEAAADTENSGLVDGKVIRMGIARSDRFIHTLDQTSDAVESLRSSVDFFPLNTFDKGEMSPSATVTAFADYLLAQLRLLHAMVNNEEERDA